jgi:hypothetical protein
MLQFGGKDSKRHFTVVMEGKEHGLYVSSTPSSAAKKAVTKLCAANKSKKVEFHIREITQGSKKKTYGLYQGYIEKLKEPIELKGRVVKYKPVAKLGAKKATQKGGAPKQKFEKYIDLKCQNVGNRFKDTFVSKLEHAERAKQKLSTDKYIKQFIERIEIKEEFLRVHLNANGQENFNTVFTFANGLLGCRVREIRNIVKPIKVGSEIIMEIHPPNENFTKTRYDSDETTEALKRIEKHQSERWERELERRKSERMVENNESKKKERELERVESERREEEND